MQVSEQEGISGSREGKGRTRVVDDKAKVKPTGGRDRHPGGWSAFCKSIGEDGIQCSGYAQFRCPWCKKPVCTGCAREWHDMEEDVMQSICGTCWEAL